MRDLCLLASIKEQCKKKYKWNKLRFLYKTVNSFTAAPPSIDKNAALQRKIICKVYVPVTAQLSLFFIEYLKEYRVTKYLRWTLTTLLF